MKKPCFEFFHNKKSNSLDILLHNEIGFWGTQSDEFVNTLNKNKNVTEINVDINSPGGEVFDGFSIYNNLVKHSAKVNVYISGLAASIASVIAMAGDEITMSETAMIFMHRVSTGVRGDAQEMRETAKVLEKLENGVVAAYKTKMDISKAKIKEYMIQKTWVDAEEAKELGVIDAIIEIEESEDVENRFDFSAYNYGEIPDEVLNRFDISRKSKPLPKAKFMDKVNKLFKNNKPFTKEEDEMENKELEKKLDELSNTVKGLTQKIDEQNATIITQEEVIKNLRDNSVQNEEKIRERDFRSFLASPEMNGRITPVSIANHIKNMVNFYDLDSKNFTKEKQETPILDNYKETLKSFPMIIENMVEHFANGHNASNVGKDPDAQLDKKIKEIIARDNVAYNVAYRTAIAENSSLNTYVRSK